MIGTPRVGRHPFGVAIDSARGIAVGGNIVGVANRGSRSLTILNAVNLTPISDLTVGHIPRDVAINPLTGVVAVTDESDGMVYLVDIRYPESPVFLPPVTLPGGGRGHTDDYRRRGPRARPVGIAFDYGVGVNQFVVADENRNAVHIVKLSATGTVDGIRSVDVGKRPQAIAVNPGRDWALVTSEKDDVFGLSLSSDEVSKSDRRREAAAGHRHRPADLSGRREQLEESLGLGAGGAVPTSHRRDRRYRR